MKKRSGLKRRLRRRGLKMVKMISNGNRKFTAIIEAMFNVTNPATGVAGYSDVAINATLNHPGYGYVASGEGSFPTVSNCRAALFDLFDLYRVKKLETMFIPDFVDTQTTASTLSADAPSIMYAYNDKDDNALITDETHMFNGGIKPRTFVAGKPIKHMFNNPDKEWLNCQALSVLSTDAVTQTTTQHPRAYASTKLYFPRLYHNAAAGVTVYFGRLYFRWLVEFKGIRANAV